MVGRRRENRDCDDDDAHESPSLWFCYLEAALRTGDRDREEVARRELRRLGVDVLVDRRAKFLAPTAEDAGR